jgi:large subunit ribosomal protein L5
MKQNIMTKPEIEKMVVQCGGINEKLDRSIKLLEMITKRKVCIAKSHKRIPAFGISPGKKSGCRVTIRDREEIIALLKRFFAALDNKISEKQICDNHFSFGIKEYIEIPGLEYNRDIGILGFEADVTFSRKGKRVKRKKLKQGKYPKRQAVKKEEIKDFLVNTLKLEVVK